MCSLSANLLESLSNEILLETFEYLDVYNLYHAFHGLNHRINNVLKSAHLHLVYNSSCQNRTVWDTFASLINPSQIRFVSRYKDSEFHQKILESTNGNLRTLIVRDIPTVSAIDTLVQCLSSDQRIKCLYLTQSFNRVTHDDFLLDYLLSKPHPFLTDITRLSLSFTGWPATLRPVSSIFPQLRQLALENIRLTEPLYPFLLNNTPNLQSLKLFRCISYDNRTWTTPLKHIVELQTDFTGDFGSLQRFLCAFPCLRRLHVDWTVSSRSPAPNGVNWQTLIERYLPELKQLSIDFGEGTDETIIQTFYTGEFWSTRKVNMIMVISKSQSRFPLVKTIYIGRKWHFDYFDHFQI